MCLRSLDRKTGPRLYGLPALGLKLSTNALRMTAGGGLPGPLPAAVVLVKTCGWLQALFFVREA